MIRPLSTLHRFLERRCVDHYWETNLKNFENGLKGVLPMRTSIAWWCQNRIEELDAVIQVLVAGEADSAFSRLATLARWFYKIKTIVCLCLGRDGGKLDGDLGYARGMESFPVVFYDLEEYQSMDGPGGCCLEVRCGSGIFTHWFAYVERESWP